MIIRISIFAIVLLLSGCEGSGRFGLHSSLLGQFATTTATSTEKGGRYNIKLRVVSEGLINLIKGKRTEIYKSHGFVRHGKYYSKSFVVEKKTSELHSIIEYKFDYKKKRITRHFTLWKNGKKADQAVDVMKYFGHDDFLTIFHNTLYKQPKTNGKRFAVTTAAAENSAGKVPVYISNDPKILKKWGGKAGDTLIQMGIAKKIFKGAKGSVTAILDKNKSPYKMAIKTLKIVGTVKVMPIK
jgi:hypothetical protein